MNEQGRYLTDSSDFQQRLAALEATQQARDYASEFMKGTGIVLPSPQATIQPAQASPAPVTPLVQLQPSSPFADGAAVPVDADETSPAHLQSALQAALGNAQTPSPTLTYNPLPQTPVASFAPGEVVEVDGEAEI